MPTWPTSPAWSDINGVNKGNEYAGGDGIYYSDLNIVVNNINYLYKNMTTDSAIDRIESATTGIVQQVSYDKTLGAEIKSYAGITYIDTTPGAIKVHNFQLTSKLPIIPGKYISLDVNSDNDTLTVKVDDTALALDYYKVDKTTGKSVSVDLVGIPCWDGSKIQNVAATTDRIVHTLVLRDDQGDGTFTSVHTVRLLYDGREAKTNDIIFSVNKTYTEINVTKTASDTGTLDSIVLENLRKYPQLHIIYDDQVYYRYDPLNAPDGTLNFIHLDSLQDGNGGYKATGKCFSVTVSTGTWQVVDLNFGNGESGAYIPVSDSPAQVVPVCKEGVVSWSPVTTDLAANSIVMRDESNNSVFNVLYARVLSNYDASYQRINMNEVYRACNTEGSDQVIQKTPTNTGTLSTDLLAVLQETPNSHIVYDDQLYYRMNPTNAPDDALNYIHIDGIQDGNGGYKATGKCFSVTVSTRDWQVVNLNFGRSYTHNLTIYDQVQDGHIYLITVTDDQESYATDASRFIEAIDGLNIPCTFKDTNGEYFAGSITSDGGQVTLTYGAAQSSYMTQDQMTIEDVIR